MNDNKNGNTFVLSRVLKYKHLDKFTQCGFNSYHIVINIRISYQEMID